MAATTAKRGRGRPKGSKNKPRDPEALGKKPVAKTATARKVAKKKKAPKKAPPAEDIERQGFLTEELEQELSIPELDAVIVSRWKADRTHAKAADERKSFTVQMRELLVEHNLERYICRTNGRYLEATRKPHEDDIGLKELTKEPTA